MFKILITDLDEMRQRLRMEWAKLDHAAVSVRSWSTQNKLSINTDKTKEIIFHRPAATNLIIPPPLPGIQRTKQAENIDISFCSFVTLLFRDS